MSTSDNSIPAKTNGELEESDEDIDENCAREFMKIPCLHAYNSKNDEYILHLSATNSAQPNIAAASSVQGVNIFRIENDLVKISSLHESEKIVDLSFQRDSCDLLWTASSNNEITLWDLRIADKKISVFSDTTDGKIEKDRTFTSFDLSSNNRLLCAGTDLFEGDSFILFWDVRNVKLLGAFWESHTDDITQVKFHPENFDKLMSGSTDGLINIYDLSEMCEDDALIETLNTESSIEKLNWNNKNQINCITHTCDVQVWETDGVQPITNLNRNDIAKGLMRTSPDYMYVVDVFSSRQNQFLLAGSNVNNGECVRGLHLLEKNNVRPLFQLENNKQRIRSSFHIERNQLLITGGEKGILNIWKLPQEIL